MKQLIQSYKTGELGIYEVPNPVCDDNGILIQTVASLVSAGTEKMIVDIAKKSLIGKARARPDLVKQVINKMKQEGIKNTLDKVFTKLDTPIPLGYSCVGRVIEVGSNVDGVSIGDRVSCGGASYASHSEINFIPRNLFVKVPEKVSDVDASFVTVGAIALQGVRQAEPTLGEKVAVMGLGLIGQLTVQLLKANGCMVLGTDIDENKLSLAAQLGADVVCKSSEIINTAQNFTDGFGFDSVIITASTPSNQPILDAGEIARFKGKVVIVGMVGMDIPRNIYYKKELDIRLSMAYGPGRYDPMYEIKGIDYPYPYVRWTEQRNFEAFLNLVENGKVTPTKLVTHQFDFDNALKAYDLLEGKTKEKYFGIVLKYNHAEHLILKKNIQISDKNIISNKLNIGLIGSGNFTKSVILPLISKIDKYELVGICTATGISAHATGKKYNFKYITTDDDEVFKNKEINSVIVTTRHNDHANKILKAIKYHKHVFVEKPLCIKEDELENIKQTYSEQKENIILQVGFNRRFSPMIQKMKSIVKDKPMLVNYRINAGSIPKDSWIQDMETGGGRIIGEVCHFIDTCSYLIGCNPVSVFASCVRKNDKSIPDEDNVNVILNYENGSTAAICYMAYGNKQMSKEYVELFSDNVAMKMNDYRELIIYKGTSSEKIKNFNQDKGFKNEFESFKNAVLTGVPAISFESIYKTTKATFKILESIKNQRLIKVD